MQGRHNAGYLTDRSLGLSGADHCYVPVLPGCYGPVVAGLQGPTVKHVRVGRLRA